jgi:hypothetical protein
MKRIIANTVIVLSLLLFVVTAAAIIRSFFATDMVEHFTFGPHSGLTLRRSRIRVISGRGMIYAAVMDETAAAVDAQELKRISPIFIFEPRWGHDVFPADWANRVDHQWLGCGYEKYAVLNPTGWAVPRNIAVRFPLAAFLPIFAAPILVSLLLRRRARLRQGCCVGCGYDLRASPHGCPECGAGRLTARQTIR